MVRTSITMPSMVQIKFFCTAVTIVYTDPSNIWRGNIHCTALSWQIWPWSVMGVGIGAHSFRNLVKSWYFGGFQLAGATVGTNQGETSHGRVDDGLLSHDKFDRYQWQEHPIFGQNYGISAFICPTRVTAYKSHGEIWHVSVHQCCSLACQMRLLIGKDCCISAVVMWALKIYILGGLVILLQRNDAYGIWLVLVIGVFVMV